MYIQYTAKNWDRWGTNTEYVNGNTWPITIEITNDVSSNEVTVVFDSATVHLECVYSDVFDTDTDLAFGIYPGTLHCVNVVPFLLCHDILCHGVPRSRWSSGPHQY